MSWDHRAFDGAYAAGFLVQGQGDPRDPRLVRRAVTMTTAAARPLARHGCPTARRSRCSRRCSRTASSEHLLLLEHPHVFTHGPRADLAVNVRVDPASVGADLVAVKRGGDVTYHGPGQLVGYPIVNVSERARREPTTSCAIQRLHRRHVCSELGVADVGCLDEYPGCVGRCQRARTRARSAPSACASRTAARCTASPSTSRTDMRYMRDYIVPCGIADKPVTSLAEEGVDASLADVVDVVARHAARAWGDGAIERQDVAWQHRPDDLSAFSRGEGPGERGRAARARLEQAGVADGLADRDPQARLAAPEGACTGPRCSR